MKLSRQTKNWLKIQGEIYDRFLDYLDKPSIVNYLILNRLGELVEQVEAKLKAEGLDDIDRKHLIDLWIIGLR